MNWEITTFIAYFVILLGVALVFYFNGTNKNSEDLDRKSTRRNSSH